MLLTVEITERGPWTVLAVSGEIDMSTGPQLRREVIASITRGRQNIAIDLARVAFIDSAGLGVLIGGLKRCRSHGGDLCVVGLTEQTQDVFDLTGLSGIFRHHPTLEALLECLPGDTVAGESASGALTEGRR